MTTAPSTGTSRIGLARTDLTDPYSDVAKLRDVIQRAVRAFGTSSLRDMIPRDARVLIKPNWVLDHNRSGAGMDCMVTHLRFVEAVVLELLAASPKAITIGDAPIQSADFGRLVPDEWQRHVKRLGDNIPIDVVDLRNVITRKRGRTYEALAVDRRRDRIVEFDLGSSSLLDEVSSGRGTFRCTNYSPERIEQHQRRGVHKYIICREPLEADVVINLPKLKSHCKAGITAALKNLVGINGDKDYLPHHRIGSPAMSGDCYDQPSVIKRTSELLLDAANRRIGRRGYQIASLLASASARVALPIGIGRLEGAWHGNDTVWRMALDLNRILLYGRPDGSMSDAPQRRVISITDALVAGQGEGPLAPSPIPLGVVTVATNGVFADLAHAGLMHFDWRLLPIVREAFRVMRWPLVETRPDTLEVVALGKTLTLATVSELGRPFMPPTGWRGHVELRV